MCNTSCGTCSWFFGCRCEDCQEQVCAELYLYASIQAASVLLHLLTWCIVLLCLTNTQKHSTPTGPNASSHKHVCRSVSITVFQHCPCVNPGSSDVTATSTTAATPSRRLLQTSTENIGLNITLPAGTNITQAIATLTAASGNGTGTLLTAAQQAYVLLCLGLLSPPCRLPGPAVIPISTAWACCCCALVLHLSHVARWHSLGQPCHHWADPDCSTYFANQVHSHLTHHLGAVGHL